MSSENELNTLILQRNKTKPESLSYDSLPHDGEGSAKDQVVLSQQALDASLSARYEHIRQVAGFLFSFGVGYTRVAWLTGMNSNRMRDWERAFTVGMFHYEPIRRLYSEKDRLRALVLHKQGKNLKQISVVMICSRGPYAPEETALALKLRRGNGLPADEIALEIGCSFPTARRWLKEAQEISELEKVTVCRRMKDKSDAAQTDGFFTAHTSKLS